jgi:AsmA family/AsmA-like C-terminal region
MARLTAKRVVLGAAVAVLLAAVVPPLLNVNRYRSDVANAIGRALGRKVSVGSVSLRMLPQPGFALSNFVVSDDPSFSREPVILAQDVTASLRLSSLWRGRLEIAKLSLSYPSLNLVRRPDGRWNLESLLERTTHSETAPTATKPESRPRFPYIEAEGGRINLKLGQEKKAYALSGADFALWLASERQWRLRLAAQPVRTDDNLSDTGTVRLSGSFGAASDLMDTPLALQLTLEGAQLGQFTRLIYGFDSGWRGAVDGTVVFRGTPAKLEVAASAAVDDFHHFDIYGGDTIRLGVQCTAALSATAQELRDLACNSSLGGGAIEAKGWARWASSNPGYGLTVSAQSLEAEQLLRLAKRMEKDLPGDLDVSGKVNASVDLSRDEQQEPVWHGEGTTADLVLRSKVLPDPLRMGKVRFDLVGPGTDKPLPRSRRNGQTHPEPMLSVAAFPLHLGGGTAASSQAWLSRTGYRIQLEGNVDSGQILRLASALALPAPTTDIRGTAQVDFELADTWAGTEGPSLLGSARLRNVSAQLDGLAYPLMIRSGRLVVSPESIMIRNATFGFPGLLLRASGWVRKPRRCRLVEPPSSREAGREASCLLEFRLAADQAATADLARLLTAPKQHRPWYRLIRSGRSAVSPLMHMRAAGTLTVAALKVNSVAAHRLRANVEWSRGILQLKDLHADLWEGQQVGTLRADFRGTAPAYEWTGELQQVALEDLSRIDRQGSSQPVTWAEGKATLTGSVKASGSNASQLRASASGAFHVNWRKGLLHGLALDGEGGPLRLRSLNGTVEFQAGELKVTETLLQVPEASYAVSGTATLAEGLKIRLTRIGEHETAESRPDARPVRSGGDYWITGQLEDPTVQEISAETASPLASSNPEVRKQVELKAAVSKAAVQKREARNRNTAGRGAILVPANRE